MSISSSITAAEALAEIQNRWETGTSRWALIDVRSEGEAHDGSIPGFVNQPILRDDERRQVGTIYKHKGQASAVARGHELVDPVRPERVEGWLGELERSSERRALVACWRGGMRSQIAASWMREGLSSVLGAGGSDPLRVLTVLGGYKAIRGELLMALESPPRLRVLSGMTGSGKTDLLRQLRVPKADLEAFANHRGSSFGLRVGESQPAQATFENRLGLTWWRKSGTWLVEDESRLIGRCVIPGKVKAAMQVAPVVLVEVPVATRVANVYREYVHEPLSQGVEPARLLAALAASLEGIRSRLGNQSADSARKELREAFAGSAPDPERHTPWIERLLVQYYDKLYSYAFEKQERVVEFRGTPVECRAWLESR